MKTNDYGPSFICPRCGTTYAVGDRGGGCPNCPLVDDETLKLKKEAQALIVTNDALLLQKHIDAAVKELEELDYILAIDLQFICAVRPIPNGQLSDLYNKVLERANVWPAGAPVREAWCRVLDSLVLIDKHSRKAGI